MTITTTAQDKHITATRQVKVAESIIYTLVCNGVKRPTRAMVNQRITWIMEDINVDMTGTWGPKAKKVISDDAREAVYQAVSRYFRTSWPSNPTRAEAQAWVAAQMGVDFAESARAETHAHIAPIAPIAQPIAAEVPAIPTTSAIIATEEQADAFMATVKAGAAARKAKRQASEVKRATAIQRAATVAAETLVAAQADYDRQVAANPHGIIHNPTTKNFDAYRNGAIVAQAGSYEAAERQRMALIERALAQVAGDAVVTVIVETPAGDVAVSEVVLAEANGCPECDGNGYTTSIGGWPNEPMEQIPCSRGCGDADALTADEAADVDALAAHVVRELAVTGPGGDDVYTQPFDDVERLPGPPACPGRDTPCALRQADAAYGCLVCDDAVPVDSWNRQCDGCGQWGDCVCGLVSAEEAAWLRQQARAGEIEMAANAHQAPRPLPTCRMPGCGRTCATHDDWCGCWPGVPALATAVVADEACRHCEHKLVDGGCTCPASRGLCTWCESDDMVRTSLLDANTTCARCEAEIESWIAPVVALPPFVLSSLAAAVAANDADEPLPFVMTAEDYAHDRAVLLAIEARAGADLDDVVIEVVRQLAA